MLVKSAKRVSREIYWENMSTLGLLHMDSWGCCDNTWLLWKTCLHAVYHRPMALSRACQNMGRGPCPSPGFCSRVPEKHKGGTFTILDVRSNQGAKREMGGTYFKWGAEHHWPLLATVLSRPPSWVAKCNFGIAKPIGLTNQT